jgi:hypothetical protein
VAITTDRDLLRLHIGDTDAANPLFYDDELDALLAHATSFLVAAADACEILAARFARDYDIAEDGQSWSRGQRSGHYRELAATFRARAAGMGAVRIRASNTPEMLPAFPPYTT